MPTEIDPITLSVIQGALQATQRAMTTTMEKTGRSSVYAIARDYSNALFDWDARMIIQGEDIPTHLGSMVLATKAVAGFFAGEINPGDIYLHNDPTYDGSHLPDMCMYKPLFFEDELVFWVVSKGHMVDVARTGEELQPRCQRDLCRGAAYSSDTVGGPGRDAS